MSWDTVIDAFLWFIFLFVLAHTASYLVLNWLAWRAMLRQRAWLLADGGTPVPTGAEPPISLIVPAFNEEHTIVSTVRSAMQLAYPDFEILVVNDGSRDGTLDAMVQAFGLAPFPEALRVQLQTERVRRVWWSGRHPNLRVIDKDNGGKADAINAGINIARHPLVCVVDADSILMRDSLLRVVQPFVHDPRNVACGGTVRIANGCTVESGFLTGIDLPRTVLPLFQVVEYLRAFLFGRMGWSQLNALLIISGAFGVMRKSVVVECGGYLRDTVGEDMELVLRMHRLLKAQKRPYRITFVPDPIIWTDAPDDLRTLMNQRSRWQRGLSESLWKNRGLLFSRHGGAAGWLAFPFFLLFEWLSPVVELAGYAVTVVMVALGQVSWVIAAWFLAACLSFGLLLSTVALLLEEMAYHLYPRPGQLARMFWAVVLENFGYRQLIAWFRLVGMVKWLTRRRASWGAMRRSGTWQRS
jgi:cellulose synthase/poly-beta-1,6-N-acetylglucosamine synthase-like glycosyltransferase